MQFYQYIHDYHWLSVAEVFLAHYPEEQSNLDDFAAVFESLRYMDFRESEIIIQLHEVRDSITEEIYVSVTGKKLEDPDKQHFALEFTPWEEWLGMELHPQTEAEFTPYEIIVHCLYEMTFLSFEQDEIARQLEELKATAAAIDQMSPEERDQHFQSFEEFLKQLNQDEEESDASE